MDGNRNQRTTYRGDNALERAVTGLRNVRLETAPGERFHYSNANYAILAAVIEKTENSPFEAVLEKRIFLPLGMKNTFVQIPTKPIAAEAKGHLQWFGRPVEDHFIAGRMKMGSGGVTASAEDLVKYMIAVAGKDPRIIPPSLTKSWARKNDLPYEFGWEHDTFVRRPVIFHTGMNPGFRSVMMYDLDTSRGGVFLTNMSGTLQGNLPEGAIRYALGLPAASIAPSGVFVALLWGSLGLLVVLASAFVFSIVRLRKHISKPWRRSRAVKGTLIVAPSFILVAFAFAMLFYVPRSFGVNFAAASLFNPDLGLLLLALSSVAFFWAVARTVLLIQRCGIGR